MNIFRSGLVSLAALSALLASVPAQGQVVLNGTRQIFPGAQREITTLVQNVGNRASLIQAWTDDGDKQAGPDTANTPFVLRPPVFRLDPGKSQALRIVNTSAELPQDRESIYWLNVLDIPPSPTADDTTTGNFLQFSLRTRIKLIYRPKGLDSAVTAPSKLQWSVVPEGRGWALQAVNPTAYYVHVNKVGLRIKGTDHDSRVPEMIAPMSTMRYPLQGITTKPLAGNVQIEYINDQGGIQAHSTPLSAI